MLKLRKQVWARCAGMCERCGIQLGESWALHHRKLRSRGGKDEITNLVALHHHCHNLGTDSVHLNPEAATRDGFMVASWDEPDQVPLVLADRYLAYLLPDGRYGIIEERDGHGW